MTTQSNIPSFENFVSEMKDRGMAVPKERFLTSIQDARRVLESALRYFIGLEKKTAVWLPEYDEIAEWLSNNNGRGLFMFGNCGRGKTILGKYVIPAILLKYQRVVVSTFDMNEVNKDIDKVLGKRLISIDDLGTESLSVKFGEKRFAFPEIIDSVEKNGKLLIVSTNLTGEEIRERYDDRVIDRIHSTMTQVNFNGKSLRK